MSATTKEVSVLTQRATAHKEPINPINKPKSINKKYAHPKVTLNMVVKKLNTKEDKFNAHKTFGIMALLSFFYRYFYVFPITGTLGFDHLNVLNIGTMVVHTLLSCSAIIFHVPLKRIYRQPTMIWHEYRMHAIVFTLRCTVVYALAALTQDIFSLDITDTRTQTDVFINQCIRACLTLSMHVLADIITYYHGESGKTTVRGDESRPPKKAFIKPLSLLYASYQFLALGSHLLPHPRAMDLAFNTLIAIQSSAFCMTLNRKGLIHWTHHAIIYGICLFISGGFIVYTYNSLYYNLSILAAAIARTQFRTSKYLIWCTFATGWALGGYGATGATGIFILAGIYACYMKVGYFKPVSVEEQ